MLLESRWLGENCSGPTLEGTRQEVPNALLPITVIDLASKLAFTVSSKEVRGVWGAETNASSLAR